MRTLYLLMIINISLVLTSCASIKAEQPVDTTGGQKVSTDTTRPTVIPAPGCAPIKRDKNPLAVSFYNNKPNLKHYKVIGTGIVSKYNTGGIKRQEAYIQDNMRKIAAAMGGDAVINVTRNNKIVSGTVVSIEEDSTHDKNV